MIKKPIDSLINPEKLVLTRDEMIKLLEKVNDHWRRDDFNTIQNLEYTALTELTKQSIKRTNIKVLETVWFGTNFFMDEIRTLNALKLSLLEAELDRDIERKRTLLNMEWHRVNSGEIFIDN